MAEVTIKELLEEMVFKKATDLHLVAGAPPYLRIDQQLVPTNYKYLTSHDVKALVYSLLTETQRAKLEEELELDFAVSIEGLSRFRCNAFFQRGTVAAAIRRIPFQIPQLETLGLPAIVHSLVEKDKGLVLVTGPTGSGKSTTLASLIDRINQTRAAHIITLEDPIEYLHRNKKSIIAQREVGQDTKSFARALKYTLRQDPDVIMVGEMRDLETIQSALVAAETGHLVFATLHTGTAIESINRIIDVFPPHQQDQVRVQLAGVLEAVIAQKLLPHARGKGMVLATEVLVATPAVQTLIRESRVHEMYGVMQASQAFGMQTMNMSLANLYKKGAISLQTAMLVSPRPDELKKMIGVALKK
ncbi:type IV pili twitching motility protein PilT [Thermococci archaeon]|nr:MAG: type IV pili twitching motility protein PilT [Thermococci archaeon]RLF98309.1 MAG: type IV pili twitching motility protein PilT [Thermococci archaeon]